MASEGTKDTWGQRIPLGHPDASLLRAGPRNVRPFWQNQRDGGIVLTSWRPKGQGFSRAPSRSSISDHPLLSSVTFAHALPSEAAVFPATIVSKDLFAAGSSPARFKMF